jgi:hypothetical protein
VLCQVCCLWNSITSIWFQPLWWVVCYVMLRHKNSKLSNSNMKLVIFAMALQMV